MLRRLDTIETKPALVRGGKEWLTSTPVYSLETGGSMKAAWPSTTIALLPISQKISAKGDANHTRVRPMTKRPV